MCVFTFVNEQHDLMVVVVVATCDTRSAEMKLYLLLFGVTFMLEIKCCIAKTAVLARTFYLRKRHFQTFLRQHLLRYSEVINYLLRCFFRTNFVHALATLCHIKCFAWLLPA